MTHAPISQILQQEAYDEAKNAISRTPVQLVVITLDYCGRTFGVAPCTATGLQCYNTYPTCKDRANYLRETKSYRYTTFAAPLPFKDGELPYVDKISLSPTELKADGLVTARATIAMVDDFDQDVGADPYLRDRYADPRTAPKSSYWKKWKERNKNYNGRRVVIYDGFLGVDESGFKPVFTGSLENIKTLDAGGVDITVVDLLKTLDKIEVPAKSNVKLTNNIDAAVTNIYCYTPNQIAITELPAAGFVRMQDEIIQYTGFNAAQGLLSGCTRGAEGTTAAEHTANETVQLCRLYGPANPFEIMKTDMLQTDAGYSADDVDGGAFDYWKTFPEADVNFRRMVSKPTKLKKMFFEIAEMVNADAFVNEDLLVTIRRRVPNEPGRAYVYLDETKNIMAKEGVQRDDNEDSRITRVTIHWNPRPIYDEEKEEDYLRHDTPVDVDAEGPNEYDGAKEKIIYCPWISASYLQEEVAALYVRNQGVRILFGRRDAEPIIDFCVEIKDLDIRTGSYALITTDEVLGRDGNPAQGAFQLIKRQKASSKSIRYWALKQADRRIAYIAPDGTADYASATDAEKEYGYICDDKGFIGEAEKKYCIY